MKEIIEYLQDNVDTLSQMVSDCTSWNGSLEQYEFFENGEFFFKEMFADPWKAVQMVCDGEYNSSDEYVQFDYDRLNSYTESERDDALKNNAEEIFENWYDILNTENYIDKNYYDSEFIELLEKYEEEN